MKTAARLWQAFSHSLNPDCAFCGLPRIPGYPLCTHCHAELPWLQAEQNTPLPGCPSILSAFAYQPPISNLLLGIKFGKNLRELATLGELTATGILPQMSQVPDAILPVPLHTARLHKRGFNQALELARPLAKQLGIPLLTRSLIRSKSTLPQTELDSTQRQHNLRQAFPIASTIAATNTLPFSMTSSPLARLPANWRHYCVPTASNTSKSGRAPVPSCDKRMKSALKSTTINTY